MSANVNSASTAYAKVMTRPVGKPQSAESRGTTVSGLNQRYESLMSTMQGLLRPTAHPQKRGSSGQGPGGPPPPDDGNDGGGAETTEVTGERGYLIQLQQKWHRHSCWSIVC